MPIDDYDQEKTLQATSFNDSGATVDKAQPIILRGNDFTGVDGFESGSSQLGFESSANISIDTNSEIFLNNSLKFSTNDESVSPVKALDKKITSDGSKLTFSFKTNSLTGNSNDRLVVDYLNSNSDSIIAIAFKGNGDIIVNGSTTVGNFSAGDIKDFTVTLDFSNNTFSVDVDGNITTGINFNNNSSELKELELLQSTILSGNIFTTFLDRLTYTSPPEDSVNAGGFIGYDSSTVTDAQDVAFYDQNDNLLDYEIENGGDLGSSSAEVVAWVYRDYTRDDSDQLKFAFGNNSANTDRQNVTGTWGNTGQNTVMVQHLQDSPLTGTDSGPNGYNGTVNGASATSNGQFDGAGSFDGNDDFINFANNSDFQIGQEDLTAVAWQNISTDVGTGDVVVPFGKGTEGGNENYTLRNVYNDGFEKYQFGVRDSNGSFQSVSFGGSGTGGGPAQGVWTQVALRFDSSAQTLNGSAKGGDTNSGTNNIGDSTLLTDTSDFIVGARPEGPATEHFNGKIDEIRLYQDFKNDAWIQADFDASPKAGQVFFTQDAAQDTAGALTATVTDSFDLTEDTSFLLKFTASDNLTVQENEEGTLSDLLDDNVTFNEQVKSRLIDSLTDQLGFAEETTRTIFQDVTDQLGFSEDINATLALTVLVSDSLQFAENIDSELRDALRDDIQLNENVESRLIDSLADQIGFTDFVQPAIAELLQDDLGFNEAAATKIQDQITEQLTLSENIESQLNDVLSQQLDFSEQTAEALADNFTDQLQFQEEVINIVDETLRDDIGFSEEVSSLITRELSDQLSFQDQVLFASLLNIEGLTEAIIKKPNRFVTMQNRTFKQGDLGDELQATLRDKNGKIDLSQISSVDFVARDSKKNKVLDEQVTISDPANGVIQYQWRQGDFIEDAGVYQAEFRINDNAGNTETVPNDGYVTIEIEEEIQ